MVTGSRDPWQLISYDKFRVASPPDEHGGSRAGLTLLLLFL